MSTFKATSPVIAFSLAIITAFASDVPQIHAKGKRPNGTCITGSLLVPPGKTCSTSNTFMRCQVVIVVAGETVMVDAYEENTCQLALYFNY